jgi:hypothetical protein
MSSAQINDLFSGDHPESSVRSVVTHVRTGLEESETLEQQAQNNSLAQFSASPDLQNEFLSAVIGAMDASEDLSAQILNNPDLSQKLLDELVPIVNKGLKAAGLAFGRHDPRHTFAVLRLSAGVHLMQVSKWLGHSTFTLTLDVYADYITGGDGGKAAPLCRPVASTADNVVPMRRPG